MTQFTSGRPCAHAELVDLEKQFRQCQREPLAAWCCDYEIPKGVIFCVLQEIKKLASITGYLSS